MKLSEAQLAEASALRKDGMYWDRIAKIVGTTVFQLRCALDPGYREYLRDAVRRSRKKSIASLSSRMPPAGKEPPPREFPIREGIPPHVLAERDRAYSQYQSLTAMIFGDPRPGRSALDRARQSA